MNPSARGISRIRGRIAPEGGVGSRLCVAIRRAVTGRPVPGKVPSPGFARWSGSAHTIDRHAEDVVAAVRAVAPEGVDRIIEMDFGANDDADAALIKPNGAIASYSSTSAPEPVLPYYPLQMRGAIVRFVQGNLLPEVARRGAIADINAILTAHELGEGEVDLLVLKLVEFGCRRDRRQGRGGQRRVVTEARHAGEVDRHEDARQRDDGRIRLVRRLWQPR